MPTSTWIALANLTLTGSDSEVTFSSIPNTYRDLVLVMSATTSIDSDIAMNFNSDTSDSNYARVLISGDGSGKYVITGNPRLITYYGSTATSLQGSIIIQIQDYSATDKHKVSLIRPNRANSGVDAITRRWTNTNAITSISFVPFTGSGTTFSTNSTFALYGLVS